MCAANSAERRAMIFHFYPARPYNRNMLSVLLAVTLGMQPAPAKALLVTHTEGFRHSSIPTAEVTLQKLADSSRIFTIDYVRTGDDYRAQFNSDNLKRYELVIFANTTGDLGRPQMEALLDWVRAGGAFAGMHSASDTYRTEQTGGDSRFVDMLGGQFAWHGAQCEVTCNVENQEHPATAHLGKTWSIFDEIYIFAENETKPVRQRATMLLSLDKHPNDGSGNAGKPGDLPISWVREFGEGRVFYTALGHREDVWENEDYQKHVLGGIRWALDR